MRMKDIIEALNKADGRLKVDKKKVEAAIDLIEEKYNDPAFAFSMLRISDGFQFLTKTEYHKTVSSYLNVKSKRRLSSAAMETLAVIAYKQPVTKSQIEQIRGVNCDYTVQRLLEKELVEITGRSPGPGRPLLYSTSKMFMDHFALGSMKDLPQLKEIVPDENVIGVPELEDDEPSAAQADASDAPSEEGLEEVNEIAAEVNAYQEVEETDAQETGLPEDELETTGVSETEVEANAAQELSFPDTEPQTTEVEEVVVAEADIETITEEVD